MVEEAPGPRPPAPAPRHPTSVTLHDVVVIGGGLAGLTAGLFTARHGRSTLVLVAGVPGGHLTSIDAIEDFPGFPDGVAGYDLCPGVQEQAANAGAAFELAEVTRLAPRGDEWLVVTERGGHRARAVIVATGSRPRELGIPGERRLLGRGVSHCASCDGPLLRGRAAGVVGGGDSALQEALTLAEHAAVVHLFHRGMAFTAQQVYQQRVARQPVIRARLGTTLEEIVGEAAVTGVRARDVATGEATVIDLAGVFIYAGLAPNTGFLDGLLRLDDDGHIPTDAWLRTERPGLFAAGDVRRDSAAQAIAAAGDGATAAVAAHRYLAGRAERGPA